MELDPGSIPNDSINGDDPKNANLVQYAMTL
jgi:hypothetical protein